jgi:hypothetical protein
LGKSFEQQSHEIKRALVTQKILSVLPTDGYRIADDLFQLKVEETAICPRALETEALRVAAFRKIAMSLLFLPCNTFLEGPRTPGVTLFYESVLPHCRRAHADAVLYTYNTPLFVEALRACARAVLRYPMHHMEHMIWVDIARSLVELKRLTEELSRIETGEYERVLMSLGLQDDRLAAAVAEEPMPELAEPAAAVAEEPMPELAAFVADHQNVHTASARTGTERAIAALLPPSLIDKFLGEWLSGREYNGRNHKVVSFFLDSMMYDTPVAVRVPCISFYRPTYYTTLSLSYKELVEAAMSRYYIKKGIDPDMATDIFKEIVSAIHNGYCDTEENRRNDMTKLLCKWTPGIGTTVFHTESWAAYTSSLYASELEETLYEIHAVWLATFKTSAENGEPYPAWTEVLEIWDEFKHDTATVKDFGTSYAVLLKNTWDYAKTQSKDIQREIAIRLAEEILDGLGMCEQGKMTRLANVLRGFYPALEYIATLSNREQLPHRMAVASRLPLEERRAAAVAAFTELGITAAEQVAWLEAVLEA